MLHSNSQANPSPWTTYNAQLFIIQNSIWEYLKARNLRDETETLTTKIEFIFGNSLICSSSRKIFLYFVMRSGDKWSTSNPFSSICLAKLKSAKFWARESGRWALTLSSGGAKNGDGACHGGGGRRGEHGVCMRHPLRTAPCPRHWDDRLRMVDSMKCWFLI